jgi:hypothetical protein
MQVSEAPVLVPDQRYLLLLVRHGAGWEVLGREGVIALSRSLTREQPFLVWIEPLGLRKPDDLDALLQGRRQVALVQVHNIGLASPAERWLDEHGRLTDRRVYDGSTDALTSVRDAPSDPQLVEISYFEPTDGGTFTSRR